MWSYITVVLVGSIFISSLTGVIGALEIDPPGIIKQALKDKSKSVRLLVRSTPILVILGVLITSLFFLISTLPTS